MKKASKNKSKKEQIKNAMRRAFQSERKVKMTEARKSKKKTSTALPEQAALPVPVDLNSKTRDELMFMAKDCGVKNYRVLNKAELLQVVTDGVTPEQINEVVSGAVARWKSGWGKSKERACQPSKVMAAEAE